MCRTRKNEHGVLYTLNYGRISSIAMDPVEKKPLYHFHPGSKVLSVGSWGCNMTCPWCQNWEIAHETPQTQRVSPERLIDIAVDRGAPGIAYTYNEPVVWFEFVLDTSRMASAEGLYNVLVTNGYIASEPFKLLLSTIQAMNIDLKGFTEKFYRKRCAADVELVKKNIATAVEVGIHVELTTLLIPGENDSPEEMEEQAQWIASLNPDIPLHLSLYYPAYKFNKPETELDTAVSLRQIAQKYLRYVYIGNQSDSAYQTTSCPFCGNTLVERKGYQTHVVGVNEGGKCSECNSAIKMIL